MSEIVVQSSQTASATPTPGRGMARNQAAAAGDAFSSLLLGLAAPEPMPGAPAAGPGGSSDDPQDTAAKPDPALLDPAALVSQGWPDLMLMQRTLAQTAQPAQVAVSALADATGLQSGAATAPAALEEVRAAAPETGPGADSPSGTRPGTPPVRARQTDPFAGGGPDAVGGGRPADASPSRPIEAKYRAAEWLTASAPPAAPAGRVDPAQVRDLPAPDFRQSLRTAAPEADVAALPAADAASLAPDRPQRQEGSAPDSGHGREGAFSGGAANPPDPLDEPVPAPGFLPEDLAAAQTATDGMAYWSTHGVHTGEIHLQDGMQDPMSIRVRVSGEEAQVSFAADQAALREQLASSADQLQALLGESGIRLTDVSVGTSGGQPQPQSQPQAQTPSGAAGTSRNASPLQPLAPLPLTGAARRANSRLDVFA